MQNYTARRATQAGALGAITAALARSEDLAVLKQVLAGTLDGAGGGGKLIAAPDGWWAIYEKLQSASDPDVRRAAHRLAQRFGNDEAIAKILSNVTDASLTVDQRQEAIRWLAAQRHPELRPKLVGLLGDAALRLETIRAIAAYDDESLADELLKQYSGFDAEAKRAAVQTLAARPKSGWKLAQAIKSETIPRSDIPAYIPRQLRRVVGSGFVEIWGRSTSSLPQKLNPSSAIASYSPRR